MNFSYCFEFKRERVAKCMITFGVPEAYKCFFNNVKSLDVALSPSALAVPC